MEETHIIESSEVTVSGCQFRLTFRTMPNGVLIAVFMRDPPSHDCIKALVVINFRLEILEATGCSNVTITCLIEHLLTAHKKWFNVNEVNDND